MDRIYRDEHYLEDLGNLAQTTETETTTETPTETFPDFGYSGLVGRPTRPRSPGVHTVQSPRRSRRTDDL